MREDWVPNAAFDADAERFRAYRLTEEFAEAEVYYKASLQAVLRSALSAESLSRAELGGFIQRLIDRKLTADELGLTLDERALFDRWPYMTSWMNLLGGPRGATPVLGALHAWAASTGDVDIQATFEDLLRGTDPPQARIDGFSDHLSAAFKTLHADGKLRAGTAPKASLTFAASILGLVDPDQCTLWRSGAYGRAASDFGLALPAESASAAEKYAASIAMQTAIRDALRAKGIEVGDLLDVHNFLWVRDEWRKERGQWWVFQGNPARFDIDAALRALPRLTWSANQFASQIHTGDRVFLYRTGPSAAVVAIATVESDPAPIAEPVDELPFDRQLPEGTDDKGVTKERLSVWLRLDRVLDTPISRAELLADPVLKDLRNLRFSNSTNYPVDAVLAERLLARIGSSPAAPSFDEHQSKQDRNIAEILRAALTASGLWFEPWVIDDLYMALRAKPFLILTGLSGTGKTKVALALQALLCDKDTRAFVSVRPDWVDGKSLLGYHNLLTDTFIATAATRLLLDAAGEYEAKGTDARPYILLLDEMNLARVEHYFSDYLSVLESRELGEDGRVRSEPIVLHAMHGTLPAAGDVRPIPATVSLAPNVYVIGTVNIDETTHPFSRKVLDRANVVELFDVDLTRSGRVATSVVGDQDRRHARKHFTRDGSFVSLAAPSLDTPWLSELVAVNAVLERDRMHFGYRVRNELLTFMAQAGEEGLLGLGIEAQTRAFDLQLLQKVLPKLAGSRERLERPLVGLLDLCLVSGARRDARAKRLADDPERLHGSLDGEARLVDESTGDLAPADGADAPSAELAVAAALGAWPLRPEEVRFPRSARKIARMLLQLRDEGYGSFFE